VLSWVERSTLLLLSEAVRVWTTLVRPQGFFQFMFAYASSSEQDEPVH
jgi:hypothetical protein